MKSIVLLFIGFFQIAYAQSFDCSKAKSSTEKGICSSKELSELDLELNKIFRQKQNLLKQKNAALVGVLQSNQKDWIKQRDFFCSGDIVCLKNVYENRIRDVAKYDPSTSKPIDYFYVEMKSSKEAKFGGSVKYPEFFGTNAKSIQNARKVTGLSKEVTEGQCHVNLNLKVLTFSSEVLFLTRSYEGMCEDSAYPSNGGEEASVYDLRTGINVDFWETLSDAGKKKYLNLVRLQGEKERAGDECGEEYTPKAFDQTSLSVRYGREKVTLSPVYPQSTVACTVDLEVRPAEFISDLKDESLKNLLSALTK